MAVSRVGTSIELIRHGLTSAGWHCAKTQRIEGGSLGEVQLTPLWKVCMEFVDQLGPAALQQVVPTRRVAMVRLVWRRTAVSSR
ncbi:hypothetical protein THAOC_26589 [Thalassiosira oceanica]|uniref:Uncharacterized protein n=1 Tax=Thalassiosira oceanica TaxID=159749 RepID=K0S4R0_THAOC|nr:hypothetical protein THAOC_26589 [Thalassiosira oceanica]|eukprot:EJK53887.1 hypothetical protein THAOC_26589 [Thalassiosira oceanica]